MTHRNRPGRRRSWALAACITLCAAAPTVPDGLADFGQGRFAEAFEEWQAAANIGDARAALYVGVLYDSGLGVTQSYGQAMTWYRRAADAGSPAGAFNVGILFDAGLGTPPDPVQAAFWYGRAAASGFARAEYNLGLFYESGTGVPRDRQHAAALFRRAAAHGITAARAHLAALGEIVSDVSSIPPDDGMRAFQQAQHILLTRGPAEAAQVALLFRRAAERHNPLAEYDLGYCFEHGLGVSLDPAQALTWYKRAAADASDDALRSISKASASTLEEAGRSNTTPAPSASNPTAAEHPLPPAGTTGHHAS